MASKKEFVEYIVDQIDPNCDITFRYMFGEYTIYSKGKVVGLACDNKLFIKQTFAGRAFIGENLVEAPAYPGAKLSFLIDEKIEDKKWLSELISITEKELPKPKTKKKK